MKRRITSILLLIFIAASFTSSGFGADDLGSWRDFLQQVKKGEYTEDIIRPHFEALRKFNMDFLNMIKEKASWEDYVQIFYMIWQERAEKAGWQLDVKTGEWYIGFHFKGVSEENKHSYK